MSDNCTISIEKFTQVLPPVKIPRETVPTVVKITSTQRVYEQPFNLNTLANKIIDLKYTYDTNNKEVKLTIPQFSFNFNGTGTVKIPIQINNSILYPKTFDVKITNNNNNEIIYEVNNKTNHIDITVRKTNNSNTVVIPSETFQYTRI